MLALTPRLTPVPSASVRILVTGAGGAAAISLLRNLDESDTVLFAGDIDPHAAGLYLVPEEQRMLLPRGDDPGFADHIRRLCRELAVDVLIPTVDSELLAVAGIAPDLLTSGTRTVLADEVALRTSLDKLVLARSCEGIVPVPRSESFDEDFELANWSFPFIVKPRSGSGGRGVRLVRSGEDLSGIERDGSHLVQEYLPGEEYSVDVFADQRGTVRASVPRVRLKVDSGIAVASRTLHDPELESMARSVAQHLGLRYVANVQFRRDAAGRPHLLEVNPRFPGTMPLTVEAGVDMPRLAVLAALGYEGWPEEIPFREVAVVRHWKEVFVDAEAFRRTGDEASVPGTALAGVA